MQFTSSQTQHLKQLSLQEILNDLFIVLSDREKSILTRRFALISSPKATLEAIGEELSVTRERVRQIENLAIKKLKRTFSTTAFQQINQLTSEILKESGGLATEENLISAVLKELSDEAKHDKTILRLAFEINPEIRKIKKSKNLKPSWHLETIKLKEIKNVIQYALDILKNESEIIDEAKFIKQVQQKLNQEKLSLNPKTIKCALSIDQRIKLVNEGYGLSTWRHVEPKSIRDKALIILKRKQKPMHFIEIANEISAAEFSKKQVTTQAVHNELIRYEDFVLVGRGLYALTEWGFKKGTVKDVLSNILREFGPLKKQEIIKKVLERRHVKVGTISLNLQKYPEFERVGRATYKLKNN